MTEQIGHVLHDLLRSGRDFWADSVSGQYDYA
jgi:hypothetical protein